MAANVAVGIDPVPRMDEVAENAFFELLWRSLEPDDMDALDGPVVYGHVPRASPIDAGHAIRIDTGSGTRADGRLTAVLLPSRRFVSVGR